MLEEVILDPSVFIQVVLKSLKFWIMIIFDHEKKE